MEGEDDVNDCGEKYVYIEPHAYVEIDKWISDQLLHLSPIDTILTVHINNS
jgi:hypothetical protein